MAGTRNVAVVGGGLAGLAAAGLLARKGLKVTLVEANTKLGGCCANTNLEGYTFHDGALYLILPGLLDRVYASLGLNRAAILPLRRISAQTTELPDGTVVTVDGAEVVVENCPRVVDRARLREEVDGLVRKWEPVLRLFAEDIMLHPLSMPRLALKGWRHLPKFRGTIASELKSLFSDEAVRSALSGVLLFTGLPPEKTPVTSILGLVAMLTDGFYLPEGGMGRIPQTMSWAVERNGGDILLGAKTTRIVVENGRACGLEVERHGRIEADAVISTVSGMVTFGSLLPAVDVPADMRRRVESAPLSHRGFILQLGLANVIDVRSHATHVLPLMDDQYQIFAPPQDEVRWPIYSVPTVTVPELAPPGRSIVEMFPSIRQDASPDDWSEDKKAEIVACSLRALERRHHLDIVVKRALSPREARDRLHLYKGALYGLSPAADPRALFPHVTPIPGLYQAGQTTWPGYGVVPSAMSGIFAAEALLKRETG